jgi:ParB family chromosome partitioning protein
MERSYIAGVVYLVDHDEAVLIAAVEGGKLPISVAVEIANGKDHEISDALAETYESGQLRGHELAAAKRLIAKRIEKRQTSARFSACFSPASIAWVSSRTNTGKRRNVTGPSAN